MACSTLCIRTSCRAFPVVVCRSLPSSVVAGLHTAVFSFLWQKRLAAKQRIWNGPRNFNGSRRFHCGTIGISVIISGQVRKRPSPTTLVIFRTTSNTPYLLVFRRKSSGHSKCNIFGRSLKSYVEDILRISFGSALGIYLG